MSSLFLGKSLLHHSLWTSPAMPVSQNLAQENHDIIIRVMLKFPPISRQIIIRAVLMIVAYTRDDLCQTILRYSVKGIKSY